MRTIQVNGNLMLEVNGPGETGGAGLVVLRDRAGSAIELSRLDAQRLAGALTNAVGSTEDAIGHPLVCGSCGMTLTPEHETASQGELGWCLSCYSVAVGRFAEAVAVVRSQPEGAA